MWLLELRLHAGYVLMTLFYSQLKQLLSDYTEELHAARSEGLRKVESCMTILVTSSTHAGSD